MIWICVVICIALLLFLSAFFSAAEMTFVSLNRIKVRKKAGTGNKNAMILENLITKPGQVISAIVICNNLVNISASILAGSLTASYFGNIGVGIATALMTFFVVVFGETIPKAYGIHNEKFAYHTAKYLKVLTILFSPISRGLSSFSNLFLRLLGKEMGKKAVVTEEEIKIMLDLGVQDGTIKKDEKFLVNEVFDFDETETKEVFIPLNKVFFIREKDNLKKLKQLSIRTGHSRFPVMRKNKQDIIGVVHVKDTLMKDNMTNIKEIMKPLFSVKQKTKVDDLLRIMQSKKAHMALVKSKDGEILGIVSFEDLIEEIFGEITDEHDPT
jgi:CBS domain containing-hemolysin-like protein